MDLSRVANRLFFVALVAQPFHSIALGFGTLPLNVLFTLLAIVAAVMALKQAWTLRGGGLCRSVETCRVGRGRSMPSTRLI